MIKGHDLFDEIKSSIGWLYFPIGFFTSEPTGEQLIDYERERYEQKS